MENFKSILCNNTDQSRKEALEKLWQTYVEPNLVELKAFLIKESKLGVTSTDLHVENNTLGANLYKALHREELRDRLIKVLDGVNVILTDNRLWFNW